jgi:micrococcal nuclease
MSEGMRRRFQSPYTWKFWASLILFLVITARALVLTTDEPAPADLHEGKHHVRHVIDGDTVVLDDGRKVRLIGIDAPETDERRGPVEAWGPEATRFAKDFVQRSDGWITLQFDQERFDQYGRHLAYVFVEDKLLNEELIRNGLAEFKPKYRYSGVMKRRFQHAETEAKSKHRGLWSKQNPAPTGR